MSTLQAKRALLAASALSAPTVLRPRRFTCDQFATYDRATYDSAGAFLVGELERLDPMVHEPLVAVTWHRDIDLRDDVQMGDTSTSYTVLSFASAGGAAPTGKNWASPNNTAIPRVAVDIGKPTNPLTLWNGEVAYTLPELESARLTGRPIDTQMLTGLNLKHQMDTDEQVYIGDAALGIYGLTNADGRTGADRVSNVSNVANGASGTPGFVTKTPAEILRDINELLVSVWAASGYTSPPSKVLLAPDQFGYVSTTVVSSAGNETILSFLKRNNILTAEKGTPLDIQSVKWLKGRGAGGTDRMIAYTQRKDYVRFPMVPLRAASVQYDGIWVKVPYYGKLGAVETVYPEAIGYRDGI